MKARVIHITLPAILVMGIATQSVSAQGLLGKRFISFGISQINPGNENLSDFDNSIFGAGGGLNVPINPNMDAGFGFSYSRAAGTAMGIDYEGTNKAYIGDIHFHFKLCEKVKPFVGIHAGIITIEEEAKNIFGIGMSDRDDEFAIGICHGLEVVLSESLAVSSSIAYERVGDFDDLSTGIGLSLWFNEFLFGTLSTSYAFDAGDITYSAGFGFGF
jgi:opacity protein-like surface antigen